MDRVKYVARWIAMVPCALAAVLLAPHIVGVLFWITTLARPVAFDPESFLNQLFFEAVSNGAGGAAFVFVGAYVAPDRRLHAAYSLAALSVLISGITLYLAAVMLGDLWAIWEIAWTGIGSLAVVLWIHKGEIDLT